MCVCKLSDKEATIEQEYRRWLLWDLPVRKGRLADRCALFMPYVSPLDELQAGQRDAAVVHAVKEAINRFAAAGWRHGDLRWRHVGLYEAAGHVQALLFDLADVEEHVHPDTARNAMYQDLGL